MRIDQEQRSFSKGAAALLVAALLVTNGDSHESADETPDPRRAIAESMSHAGTSVNFNPQNLEAFSRLVNLQKFPIILKELDGLHVDDTYLLKANLKATKSSSEQKKLFDNLHITTELLTEEGLQDLAQIISNSDDAKRIFNRIYFDLDAQERQALEKLTQDFLKTKEGEYLTLAFERINLKLEEPLDPALIVKCLMAIVLLGVAGFCGASWINKPPAQRPARDSGADIERLRAGAARKKAAEE